MRRNRFVIALAVVGMGLTCSAVEAASVYVGKVTLTQSLGNYSNGVGGEFQATVTLDPSLIPPPFTIGTQSSTTEIGSASSTATPSVFQTLCIQEGSNDVVFSPGTGYYSVIGTTAETNNPPPKDIESLSPVTAVLYAEFWNGSLPQYDFTEGAGRSATAGQLQDAIWAAQGDNTLSGGEGDAGISNDALATDWFNAAQAFVNSSTTGTYLGNPAGSDLVQILGLYDSETDAKAGTKTGIAQAQLVELAKPIISQAPVPLPAAAYQMSAMLGVLGMFGLIRRARKLA